MREIKKKIRKKMTVILNLNRNKSLEVDAHLWSVREQRKIQTLALNIQVPNFLIIGYDEPFVSKFKYYLSSNKINFELLKKGKNHQPVIRSKFDSFPIYLKHTLFYNGEDFKKVRTF